MTSRDGGRGDRRRRAVLLLAASERLYGELLALYPKAFRSRYASEMRRDFGDLSREGLEEGGGRELARVWAATLSDLVVTALKERSTTLARNAYLPVEPRIAARWGALSALIGGSLGVAYSVAFTLAISGSTPDGPVWWDSRFTGEIHFVATFLSVLGMFGLYGALVARSGSPGKLALAGVAFAALSAASVLAKRAHHSAIMLGWVRPGVEGFSWLMSMGQIFEVLGMGGCVVGLSLLGVSAFRTRLFGSLSALPFVMAALWPASTALLILMNTSGIHWMHYVSWLSGTLPFLGAALSGWVLLKN
jgi:hypothetical protein